ncbi:carbohydrate kinase family protein [Candidatus Woesearchaeota archaeon]|nr:carbohydrate kinase family protein [Candidatus Woesearchaeota archaeon]
MLDIITIGSCTVDVFVEPEQKRFTKHLNHKDIQFCIGSKYLINNLFFSTGGGGTNTAVSFSRLGLKTGWIGVLAKDHNSHLVEHELKKEKVRILGPIKEGNIGYSVILSKLEGDRTILTHKGINDQLLPKDVPKLNTKWLYISSMMGESFNTIKKVVEQAKKKRIHWAFNPSTYLAKKGLKQLMPIISGCDLLILNKEEAQLLTNTKNETNQLLKKLQEHTKIVVVTDGKKGAVSYDGISYHTSKPNNVKILETTGAGDAFASAVLAGIIKGQDLKTALQMGQVQAESVIQFMGAKNKLLTWKELMREL